MVNISAVHLAAVGFYDASQWGDWGPLALMKTTDVASLSGNLNVSPKTPSVYLALCASSRTCSSTDAAELVQFSDLSALM